MVDNLHDGPKERKKRRERERQRQRQRDRERDRETERDTDTHREGGRERDTHTETARLYSCFIHMTKVFRNRFGSYFIKQKITDATRESREGKWET